MKFAGAAILREGIAAGCVEQGMLNPTVLTAAILAEFPKPYTFLGAETREDRGIAEADKAASGAVHTTNLCGGTCDRCGMAIHDVWRFRAGDGRVFKLGRDCVSQVFPSIEQPGTLLAKAAKSVDKRKSEAKLKRQWAEVDALLARGALDELPGPYPGRGETLARYASICDRRKAASAARILRAVKRGAK